MAALNAEKAKLAGLEKALADAQLLLTTGNVATLKAAWDKAVSDIENSAEVRAAKTALANATSNPKDMANFDTLNTALNTAKKSFDDQ